MFKEIRSKNVSVIQSLEDRRTLTTRQISKLTISTTTTVCISSRNYNSSNDMES
jgi:hypothetical protein